MYRLAIAKDADFQVLQETGAARRVMVKCGSSDMDGFAFYSGLSGLALSYKDDLRPLIYTTGYLMKGSLSRKRHAIGDSISPKGAFSLQIRPLCELVDMFHARKATDRRDKLYALLGMSSDNASSVGSKLTADYTITCGGAFSTVHSHLHFGAGVRESLGGRRDHHPSRHG